MTDWLGLYIYIQKKNKFTNTVWLQIEFLFVMTDDQLIEIRDWLAHNPKKQINTVPRSVIR